MLSIHSLQIQQLGSLLLHGKKYLYNYNNSLNKTKNVDKTYFRCLWICIGLIASSPWAYTGQERNDDSSFSSEYIVNEGGGLSGVGNTTTSWETYSRYDPISEFDRRIDFNRNIERRIETINASTGYNKEVKIHSRDHQPISKFINYHEATFSRTAEINRIDNTPDDHALLLMSNLGYNCFDKIREFYHSPIYINSFFRSRTLNTVVGGAIYSDHMCLDDSAGIDLDMAGKWGPTNNEIFYHVKDEMSYYKLIAEFPSRGKAKWVHISYSIFNLKNTEKHTYIAIMQGKRKVYLSYVGNEKLIK